MAIKNIITNATTNAGQVIGRETDYAVRIMSDVWEDQYYAIVFDGRVQRVWLGNGVFAEVDAAPEVIAAANAWKAELARLGAIETAAHALTKQIERSLDTHSNPVIKRYDEVVVGKGRKVAIGTKGRVFWIGSGDYGTRVGLELADGSKVFTAITNCTTEAEIARVAAVRAARKENEAKLVVANAAWRAALDAVIEFRDGTKEAKQAA